MRFGSVCSGIEAASVAWGPLGWEAAWLSEIEPFPCAVLQHHYPDVPNLGDMTTLPDRIRSGEVEAPDLFCGGTPCQAFSVAGLRKSLDDARGNLSLTFCEIANAIDERRLHAGLVPAVIFWENVPGVLSTKDNAFGCFLAGLVGDDEPVVHPQGKWKNSGVVVGPERLAVWRVLDAQYFGVAQRRRRVFVISVSLRHPRAWAIAESLLPLSEGVRGDTAPSREARKDVAGTIEASLGRSRGAGTPTAAITPSKWWDGKDIAATITTKSNNQRMPDKGNAQLVLSDPIGIDEEQNATVDYFGTLKARVDGGGFEGAVAYNIAPGKGELKDDIHVTDAHVSKTIDAFGSNPAMHQGGTAVISAMAFHNRQDPDISGDITHPIGAQDNGMAVAFQQTADCLTAAYGTKWNGNASANNGSLFAMQSYAVADAPAVAIDTYNQTEQSTAHTIRAGAGMEGVPATYSVAPTITASNDPSRSPQSSEVTQQVAAVHKASMQVRRLTPVECERLQGFPDNYTAIPWRKKPASECPDGPRYKALGNSWAVPVVRWIGSRLDVVM